MVKINNLNLRNLKPGDKQICLKKYQKTNSSNPLVIKEQNTKIKPFD